MERAIGSHIALNEFNSYISIEFNDFIHDLIELKELELLKSYSQHCNTSRYQHSLNVSYYSYLLAKLSHCDSRSAARGGLLHDLFYYDWRSCKMSGSRHLIFHPRVALYNARKICDLNEIEEDIIIKHMWPATISPPKFKESYIVTLIDKYCAVSEMTCNFSISLLEKIRLLLDK